ncbi:MAG: riboflavin synthase [Thermodesulfovibrionia bacterium]
MFTGIVEGTGTVTSIKRLGKGVDLSIKPFSGFETNIGDSVSVNGVCLTVVEKGGHLLFNVSPETLNATNLGELKVNDIVNLERALRIGDRLGGHIVTGHVDATARLIDKRTDGGYTFYRFEPPSEILRYMVIKGSVTVDGISLTVTGLDNRSFSVAIIPHTMEVTNIGDKRIGDKVNIEVDIIGKYIERLLGKKEDKLMALLKEGGFLEG